MTLDAGPRRGHRRAPAAVRIVSSSTARQGRWSDAAAICAWDAVRRSDRPRLRGVPPPSTSSVV